jgi:hypothetical protein
VTPSTAPDPTESHRGIEPTDAAVDRTSTGFDDRSRTPAERPSVEAVSAALSSLADGTAPRSVDTGSIDHRRVVRAANRATRRVHTAATFVSNGGLARLRDAVRAARRRGDEDVARRGQAVLDLMARYRRAAATHEAVPDDRTASDDCRAPDDRRAPDRDDRETTDYDGRADATPGGDRSRGTILPGDGQTSGR